MSKPTKDQVVVITIVLIWFIAGIWAGHVLTNPLAIGAGVILAFSVLYVLTVPMARQQRAATS